MADLLERFLEATDHGGGASASDQEERVVEARQVARELLITYWTAYERHTPEAASAYWDALKGALADPETAVDVMHQMTRIAGTAVARGAAFREIEYHEVVAQVQDAIDTMDREGGA
jgi:hypothetical protein